LPEMSLGCASTSVALGGGGATSSVEVAVEAESVDEASVDSAASAVSVDVALASDESVESLESVESVESVESLESLESVESDESVESLLMSRPSEMSVVPSLPRHPQVLTSAVMPEGQVPDEPKDTRGIEGEPNTPGLQPWSCSWYTPTNSVLTGVSRQYKLEATTPRISTDLRGCLR